MTSRKWGNRTQQAGEVLGGDWAARGCVKVRRELEDSVRFGGTKHDGRVLWMEPGQGCGRITGKLVAVLMGFEGRRLGNRKSHCFLAAAGLYRYFLIKPRKRHGGRRGWASDVNGSVRRKARLTGYKSTRLLGMEACRDNVPSSRHLKVFRVLRITR